MKLDVSVYFKEMPALFGFFWRPKNIKILKDLNTVVFLLVYEYDTQGFSQTFWDPAELNIWYVNSHTPHVVQIKHNKKKNYTKIKTKTVFKVTYY